MKGVFFFSFSFLFPPAGTWSGCFSPTYRGYSYVNVMAWQAMLLLFLQSVLGVN